MNQRKLCPVCNGNPVAVNYKKDGVTHYRSKCTICIRRGRKIKQKPPRWAMSGYKKKPVCEMCGFKCKSHRQMFVYHVDGNLKNVDWLNLKTVCANCRIEISEAKNLPWKPAEIVPDY